VAVLLVDIGNTRIKWARLSGNHLRGSHAAAHSSWRTSDYARRLFGASQPERMLVSSVAGTQVSRALRRAARSAAIPAHFVKVSRRAGGVTVGYADTWRLGVDRFLGAIGAHQLFPGVAVCVVAVGTAMTIDLIGADGRHRGGVIVPAPQLMVDTLLERTSGIRRRAQGGAAAASGLFGRSTRAAIVQGSRYAAAALIDRLVHHCHLVTIRGNSYRMRQHSDVWKTLHTAHEPESSGGRRRRKRKWDRHGECHERPCEQAGRGPHRRAHDRPDRRRGAEAPRDSLEHTPELAHLEHHAIVNLRSARQLAQSHTTPRAA